jgi:hypothetical protein
VILPCSNFGFFLDLDTQGFTIWQGVNADSNDALRNLTTQHESKMVINSNMEENR